MRMILSGKCSLGKFGCNLCERFIAFSSASLSTQVDGFTPLRLRSKSLPVPAQLQSDIF